MDNSATVKTWKPELVRQLLTQGDSQGIKYAIVDVTYVNTDKDISPLGTPLFRLSPMGDGSVDNAQNLKKMQEKNQRLRQFRAAKNLARKCKEHDAVFHRRAKDGRVWWSHKIEGGGWCYWRGGVEKDG